MTRALFFIPALALSLGFAAPAGPLPPPQFPHCLSLLRRAFTRTILDFSAERLHSADGLVYLSWRIPAAESPGPTSTEGFSVQRSLDGAAWLDVGYVSGFDKAGRTDYHYRDPCCQGAYYRIGRFYDGEGLRFSPARFVPAPIAFTAR